MNEKKIINNGREQDDLKRIRGIGSRIERKLNEIGITTYSQVAKLNEVEIYFICQNIGLDPDRIIRDQWTEDARQLLRSKSSLDSLS